MPSVKLSVRKIIKLTRLFGFNFECHYEKTKIDFNPPRKARSSRKTLLKGSVQQCVKSEMDVLRNEAMNVLDWSFI